MNENIEILLPNTNEIISFLKLSKKDQIRVITLGQKFLNVGNNQVQYWNNETFEAKMTTIKSKHKQDIQKLKSLLENAEIYLNKSIEKFNSILFSINTYDIEYENEYVKLINNFKTETKKIIQTTKNEYNEIKNCSDKENYNMFCDNDPQIELLTSSNIVPDIYNKIYDNNNIFNDKYIHK